jgi:hypothetical protein
VLLSEAQGAVLGPVVSATVTILDNDPGVQFSVLEAWAHEDLEVIELKVLRGRDEETAPFTIDVSFTAQSARNGIDFLGKNTRLHFDRLRFIL